MKSLLVTLTFCILVSASPTLAGVTDQTDKKEDRVRWTGVIKDSDFYHTTDHRHQLEFIRDQDGKSFDIVDSKPLVKLHHDKERDLRVEIEGEITSKFLFWGGNLVIKDYKILAELDRKPHLKPSRNTLILKRGR